MQAADSQQRRHDEVVAHHGAERHGLDNDHARRGGKPADEGKQRDRLLTLGHRQGQHERVGVHASMREVEQATEGDRQDEDIDEEKIEREQPDRLLDMPLVDVLDHEHLELSRQDENRQHREHGERDPARITGARIDGEQFRQVARGSGAREQIAEPLIHSVGDEHAYGEERQQLDHRLEGDGSDHSLVVLARIDVPRPEQDGEGRHDEGHIERSVPQDGSGARLRRHHDFRIAEQHREAHGDRFELQRDIRKNPDHRDDCHQAAEIGALAIARRDEIGDRGDAVDLADANDLPD